MLPLCGIIYFAVSGGPEGTEGLVRTGGPAGALVGNRPSRVSVVSYAYPVLNLVIPLPGLAVTALVWSLPIALLSTEVSLVAGWNRCRLWRAN